MGTEGCEIQPQSPRRTVNMPVMFATRAMRESSTCITPKTNARPEATMNKTSRPLSIDQSELGRDERGFPLEETAPACDVPAAEPEFGHREADRGNDRTAVRITYRHTDAAEGLCILLHVERVALLADHRERAP